MQHIVYFYDLQLYFFSSFALHLIKLAADDLAMQQAHRVSHKVGKIYLPIIDIQYLDCITGKLL